MSNTSYNLQGLNGSGIYIAGETCVVPSRWLKFEEDTVLSGVVASNIKNAGRINGYTYVKGDWLAGSIESFTVVSGRVVAFCL